MFEMLPPDTHGSPHSLSLPFSSSLLPPQTLLPCFVAQSGMHTHTAPVSLFTPSPETYVRHAIATLGIRSRVSGYWPHAIQVSEPAILLHGHVSRYDG